GRAWSASDPASAEAHAAGEAESRRKKHRARRAGCWALRARRRGRPHRRRRRRPADGRYDGRDVTWRSEPWAGGGSARKRAHGRVAAFSDARSGGGGRGGVRGTGRAVRDGDTYGLRNAHPRRQGEKAVHEGGFSADDGGDGQGEYRRSTIAAAYGI